MDFDEFLRELERSQRLASVVQFSAGLFIHMTSYCFGINEVNLDELNQQQLSSKSDGDRFMRIDIAQRPSISMTNATIFVNNSRNII